MESRVSRRHRDEAADEWRGSSINEESLYCRNRHFIIRNSWCAESTIFSWGVGPDFAYAFVKETRFAAGSRRS